MTGFEVRICCWKIPLYQLSHTTAQLLYGHYVLTPGLPLSCSISHLNGSTFFYFHRPCTSLPPSLYLSPFVLFFSLLPFVCLFVFLYNFSLNSPPSVGLYAIILFLSFCFYTHLSLWLKARCKPIFSSFTKNTFSFFRRHSTSLHSIQTYLCFCLLKNYLPDVVLTVPENTHCLGKYRCMAGLQLTKIGFDKKENMLFFVWIEAVDSKQEISHSATLPPTVSVLSLTVRNFTNLSLRLFLPQSFVRQESICFIVLLSFRGTFSASFGFSLSLSLSHQKPSFFLRWHLPNCEQADRRKTSDVCQSQP